MECAGGVIAKRFRLWTVEIALEGLRGCPGVPDSLASLQRGGQSRSGRVSASGTQDRSGRQCPPYLALFILPTGLRLNLASLRLHSGMSRPQRWARAGPPLPLTPKKLHPERPPCVACGTHR